MRYAVSMYRAGMTVPAESCDYDSAKVLGLVCPFCSQALFWRTGNAHDRQTKTGTRLVSVAPAFCHYKSDDPLADDCELRSQRPEGQEYIQRLEIESRNQRLKLFNDHLWGMVVDDRRVKPKGLGMYRKLYGHKWCEATARAVRKVFHEQKELVYSTIDETTERLKTGFYDNAMKQAAGYVLPSTKEECKEMAHYFQNLADTQLHKTLCCEIADFLGTRTGGYAFERCFLMSLADFVMAAGVGRAHLAKTMTLVEMAIAVTHFIVDCRWIEQVQKRLGETQ